MKLKISATGASVMPSEISSRFTTPLRPSRIIQAKVRTRKLVQNGISTSRVKDVARSRRRVREQVGDRIASEQRQRRRPTGDLEGDDECLQVDRGGDDPRRNWRRSAVWPDRTGSATRICPTG